VILCRLQSVLACAFLWSSLAGRGADFSQEEFRQTKLEAEKGDLEAQVQLGQMYFSGEGVPQNYKEALKWYRQAAEKGNAGAQNNLALMHLNGNGVAKNPIEGAKWMRMAATKGLPRAQVNFGRMYMEGVGVGRNALEAVRWFRRAAEQGDQTGQRTLGQAYAEGQGVRVDLLEAYKWFSLAAAQGDGVAKEGRDEVAKLMTDRQIADGQRQATAFVARPEPGGAIEPRVTGTGFFVTNDGYFVTCHHVVDTATRIVIKTRNVLFTARLVKANKTNDLALLKVTGALSRSSMTNAIIAVPGPSVQALKSRTAGESSLLKVAGGFRPLRVERSEAVRLGDAVSTFGFPNIAVQGRDPKWTRGEINSLNGIKDNPRYFQVSAPIQPGNSGGPLFDGAGGVIGVVALSLNDLTHLKRTGAVPQNVNYAVKSSLVVELLESVPEVKMKIKAEASAVGEATATAWISEAQESVALVQVY
jgi:S1-C subfamily serine protease